MSDSLFLPRELFQPDAPASARPTTTPAAAPQTRRGVQFASGAEVAADLLKAMHETPAFVERRRKPRTGSPTRARR